MIIGNIYSQIDEQREVLVQLLNAKNPIAPTRLSEVCMKLSILNELLGDHLADLKSKQLNKEKQVYGTAIAGMSATAANTASRHDSIEERQAYERAYIRHTDLWKLISMAQTHIRSVSDSTKGIA